MTAYGFRLRPPYTWLDVAIMYSAVVEGELAWGRITTRPVLSTGQPVLAGVILALVPALYENAPADLETCYAVAK